MRQDDVSARCLRDIDLRSYFHLETDVGRSVCLRDNHDLTALQRTHMAALQSFVREAVHHRNSIQNKALGGRMLLNESEELESQGVTLFFNLRHVPSPFQAYKHPEDFRHSPFEFAG